MRYEFNNPLISSGPSLVDWMYRYEPVLDFILENGIAESILDFGCGNVGLGSVYLGRYYGIDITPIVPAVPNLIPINQSNPFDLREEFDLVCAMDVLEHIPVSERSRFFQTLRRITKRNAILSFPTSETGRMIDIETMALFCGNNRQSIPPWLLEHLSTAHPQVKETAEMLVDNNFKIVRRISNTSRLLHYLGCIGVQVQGEWKVKVLNDINIMNRILEGTSELATYREFFFVEAC